MSFKSHIYDRQDIEDGNSNWPLFFLILLITILGILLIDINSTLGITIVILSVISIYWYLYKDWGKKEEEGKYVGEIVLTGDIFFLNKETFNTSDILDLKIEIGHTKGYKHWHRYGYTVSSGTRSNIEFRDKGLKRQFNFQIFSDSQLKDLKTVLEELYINGIFVKEFYLGVRTYLFDDLDYEDIQEFKKKYKLSE